MSAASNRHIIAAIYRDAAKGDMSLIERHLADDCIIEEAAGLPYAGTYIGPQGLIALFGKLAETWSPFSYEAADFIADGDYVIALITAKGASRKTGREFSMRLAEIWRFKAGRIVELRPYYWDTHALHLLNQ